jgi:hypothetical protein
VTVEAAGQQRWCARTATWLASDTGDIAVGTGARAARQGDGAAQTAERRCQNGVADRRLYGTARAWKAAADRWAPHVSDF